MANNIPTSSPLIVEKVSKKRVPDLPASALLNETQTAHILGLKPQTLRAHRVSGRGIPFIRISRRAIRYQMSDIDDYIESCRRTSTSDIGEANYD